MNVLLILLIIIIIFICNMNKNSFNLDLYQVAYELGIHYLELIKHG